MRTERASSQPPAESAAPAPRPLFDVDPGWLFIIAGLALCVAGVLLPAKRDLHELQTQFDSLRQRENAGNERLRLHARFLTDLEDPEDALLRRLAASQLNIVPAGDVPVILASSRDVAITDWIDERTSLAGRPAQLAHARWPDTTLTRLVTGPRRLWLLGGGVLAVFAGLMLGPSRLGRSSKEQIKPSQSIENSLTVAAEIAEVDRLAAVMAPDHPVDAETGEREFTEPETLFDLAIPTPVTSAQHDECAAAAADDERSDEVACEVVAASQCPAAASAEDLAGTPAPADLHPLAVSTRQQGV